MNKAESYSIGWGRYMLIISLHMWYILAMKKWGTLKQHITSIANLQLGLEIWAT